MSNAASNTPNAESDGNSRFNGWRDGALSYLFGSIRFSLEKWLEFELEKKYRWCVRGKMTREEDIEAAGLGAVVVVT